MHGQQNVKKKIKKYFSIFSKPRSFFDPRSVNKVALGQDLLRQRLVKKKSQIGAHFSQYVYFFRYMFRATMYMDDCLVFIPDSHPYRTTSTKCHINAVVSPDEGHIVAQNMQRKGINILRKIVQQVGFIYNIIQGCTANKT